MLGEIFFLPICVILHKEPLQKLGVFTGLLKRGRSDVDKYEISQNWVETLY